jgi:hypothetical protein
VSTFYLIEPLKGRVQWFATIRRKSSSIVLGDFSLK